MLIAFVSFCGGQTFTNMHDTTSHTRSLLGFVTIYANVTKRAQHNARIL